VFRNYKYRYYYSRCLISFFKLIFRARPEKSGVQYLALFFK
jgi:hypothetical protein